MQATPIYISTPRKGVVVGGSMETTNDGIKVLVKEVMRSKHYMNIVEGYGIQQEIYNGYVKNKKGWVAIEEKDTKNVLMAPMAEWQKYGKTMQFNPEDGEQRFLSEKYMTKLPNADYTNQHIKENPLAEIEGIEQPLLKLA
jgi:hypothetical protein